LENVPIITLSDLKNIVNNESNVVERKEKIFKLKQKLNNIIEEDCWTFDDVFTEHSYSNIDSSVFECIVYFLAG